MMLTGGCYCGAVRYEAHGDVFHRTLCHCADCRKVAGAPVLAWFSVAHGSLHFTRGAPLEWRSSARVTRSFCARCGTPLTYAHDDSPGEIDITTCSLDDPEAAAPEDHTWTHERLSWLCTADALPRYPNSRAGGQNE